MAINEPKKQHYVPQFLLKNFTLDKKNHINVFDIKAGKSFSSHIKHIGHENNFYNHPVEGNQIEFDLCKLESQVAPIINRIISKGSIKHLTQHEYELIGLFTAQQMMRVNSLRESLVEITEIFFDKLKGEVIAPGSQAAALFESLAVQNTKEQSIDMLKKMPNDILPYLLNKHLSLVKATKGDSFYLSDNPVVKYNNLPGTKNRGNLGLAVKGIEVHFPISPKYCISYLCSDLVSEMKEAVVKLQSEVLMGLVLTSDQADAIQMLKNIDSKNTRILTKENLDYYNSLQVLHCSRFVYSSSGNFQLLEDMLKNNPNIAFKKRVVDGNDFF